MGNSIQNMPVNSKEPEANRMQRQINDRALYTFFVNLRCCIAAEQMSIDSNSTSFFASLSMATASIAKDIYVEFIMMYKI